MILEFDDFKNASIGENLIGILREKYKNVRFDLS